MKPHAPLRCRGATMIEVLVALFVLSVGLLGVAAMQQVGLRNSHGAHLRSQATALAYDIADRMRANVDRARDQEYDSAFGAQPTVGAACPAGNSAQQVGCDLAQWRAALEQLLPLGQGSVNVGDRDPATGVQIATIVVRWDDERIGAPGLEFRTDTQL